MNHGVGEGSSLGWRAVKAQGPSSEGPVSVNAKKKKKKKYIETLDEFLVPISKPERMFQQDNAPIHKTEKVKEWFDGHGVPVME